jgi:hypothetical protein
VAVLRDIPRLTESDLRAICAVMQIPCGECRSCGTFIYGRRSMQYCSARCRQAARGVRAALEALTADRVM